MYFYIPGTTTLKNTWQDIDETVLNTNPVVLDARGEAIVWGSGAYRQVAYDQFGNLVWDRETVDGSFSANQNLEAFKGDLAGQTPPGAGLVGFLQSGANPVPRTLLSKARDQISVLDFGAACDGTTNDTAAIVAALTEASARGGAVVTVPGACLTTTQIDIPSRCTLQGLGPNAGINYNGAGSEAALMFAADTSGATIERLSVTGMQGTYTASTAGIQFDPDSSNCLVSRVAVKGFLGTTANGTCRGVSIAGTSNELSDSRIEDSMFCVSVSGNGNRILRNYISNHFSTSGAIPWTSASAYWDGIVGDGCVDALIDSNEVTDCGQSGIFIGGDNNLSTRNVISNNHVSYCWNRGIDQGLSVARTADHDLTCGTVTGNVCLNNRANNIWLAGTSYYTVSGNTSVYNADYDTWFAGYTLTRSGIALSAGGGGDGPIGNTITGNTTVDNTSAFGIAVGTSAASGNTVSGNASNTAAFFPSPGTLTSNRGDIPASASWSPQLLGGGGTVTLGSDTTATYRVIGRRIEVVFTLRIAAVSSPSGNLVVAYLPAAPGVTVFRQSWNVRWNALLSTLGSDKLTASISNVGSGNDQLTISRQGGGTLNFDVRGYLTTGCWIEVTGEIDF